MKIVALLNSHPLIAFLDFLVIDLVIKRVMTSHGLYWSDFEIKILGKTILSAWHIGFLILGVISFFLLGWTANSWRIVVIGNLLLLTGWEDIFYYLIQLQLPPKTLPWLNDFAVGVSWSRILTQTSDVTNVGLYIAMSISGLIAFLIWR